MTEEGWTTLFMLILVFVTLFTLVMWYTETTENIRLEWCQEEMASHLRSIEQCIEDGQDTPANCFLADWPKITTLIEGHGC